MSKRVLFAAVALSSISCPRAHAGSIPGGFDGVKTRSGFSDFAGCVGFQNAIAAPDLAMTEYGASHGWITERGAMFGWGSTTGRRVLVTAAGSLILGAGDHFLFQHHKTERRVFRVVLTVGRVAAVGWTYAQIQKGKR